MDARDLRIPSNSFRTVFANCVLEHIPNIETALAEFSRVLQPGGKLIATIPLAEMEKYMKSSSAAYLARRRRDLVHINLFTSGRWTELLLAAGFDHPQMTPYLRGGACKKWDDVEFAFGRGLGRLTVSQLYRRIRAALPTVLRDVVDRFWYRRLIGVLLNPDHNPICAVTLVATKRA
jgi:SAM-dependent methyltransferase